MIADRLQPWLDRCLSVATEFAGSGPLHRRRLADIESRVVVSGVRGKSTAVRWLHETLVERGYDTYGKVTGIVPLSLYNGTEQPIDRPVKVRLYENERELRRFGRVDAAVVENQGIRPYTTRLVNSSFVEPEVVFLTNVREDHLDTLGSDRVRIARSIARSVPNGTHVVNGERDDHIREYLESELAVRDAELTHVEVPAAYGDLPGAEIVYGLDAVLEALDEPPVDPGVREARLDRLQPEWTRLPSGRVYNAAAANDPQSTELIRRQLVGGAGEPIQPLAYLRADRRGRTATFLRYFEALAERGLLEQARAVGPDATLFAEHADFPVLVHDEDAEAPGAVLSAALADGWPVILTTNTVAAFMEGVAAEIEQHRGTGQ